MTTVRLGIVSWNTAELLDRCLDALPAALGDLDAHVVVVDNASSDASADVAARHVGVEVVRNDENVGYARAMNQALAGDEDVLIALNPDTEPPPGSIRTLVERLIADPAVALVGPRLTNVDGTPQHSAYRFPSLRVALGVCFVPTPVLRRGVGERLWLEGFSPHTRAVDVDWMIGAVHVIRRASLPTVAPYSERWFMYVEDLDLCRRLRGLGWRVRLEGDVAVPHVGNAAGAQAWGAGRTRRWLAATYDWYDRDRGGRAARAWAAVNLAGVLYVVARLRVLAALAPRWRANRALAHELAGALPLHARALVRGPRALRPLAGLNSPDVDLPDVSDAR